MSRSKRTEKRGRNDNGLLKRPMRGSAEGLSEFTTVYLKSNPKNAIWLAPVLLVLILVSGTTQKIMMRPGDKETTEMITDAIGSMIVEHREDADGWGNKKVTQEEQEYLSEREIQQFETRDAVIRVPSGFVHGRVKPWDHLSAGEQRKLRIN